jgi:hypothetical protein
MAIDAVFDFFFSAARRRRSLPRSQNSPSLLLPNPIHCDTSFALPPRTR